MTRALEITSARTRRPGGLWSLLGMLAVLTVYGISTGGFRQSWSVTVRFLALHADRPAHLTGLNAGAFGFLAATTVIALACAVASTLLVRAVCGKEKNPPDLFGVEPRFAVFMLVLLAEEVLARGVFLGVIGHFWTGRAATYVLFVAGNTVWALVHLANYPDARDRNPLRVLPQFVCGVFLTVIFLECGFFAALLVHVAYDMILLSLDKRKPFDVSEIGSVCFNALCLVAGLLFVGKPLSDLSQWSNTSGAFAIHGWGFWNYFWAVVVLGSALTLIGDLLLLDFDAPDETYGLVVRVITPILVVVVLTGGYWLAGLFTSNSLDRLLILVIALLFMHPNKSGSGLARTFWIVIPSGLLIACGVFAIHGFWAKVAFVLLASLLSMPEEILRDRDKD